MKPGKLLMSTAEELGYQKTAVHRETMEEAVAFMEKICQRLPDDNLRHEVLYATQVIINTLAINVARRAVKELNNEN